MDIRVFIQGFFKRKGGHIFSAVIISKVLSFFLTVIVVRILTAEDYGNLLYAYTIISFLMPFMGMGIFQSFIKYAPLQEFLFDRKNLFRYSFVGGSIASIALILIVLLFSGLVTQRVPGAFWYLIAFSLLILSHFIFESVKNYLRIFFLNKAYAQIEILHSVLVFVLGVALTYFLGAFGFIISLVLVPLILSVWLLYKKKILANSSYLISVNKSKFWIYGIYTSLGGLVSQLIYSVDIISIGNILEDSERLAQYKVLSLIPFSLLFLPIAIIKTDFVKLVQEATGRKFLINYVKNFMFIFASISFVLLLLTFFFGDWFIQITFGDKYMQESNLLMIFMLGISGAFLFRVPFGNIMVAIGWTKINTLISIATLIADVILNYFWIHEWGIMGAAYATSLLLWLSGIATFVVFIVYLSRLEN